MLAAVQMQKMVVAIDGSLFLLQNAENVDECSFLSFDDTLIEAVSLSETGSLVVCALANGNVHGIHINGTPLFNL